MPANPFAASWELKFTTMANEDWQLRPLLLNLNADVSLASGEERPGLREGQLRALDTLGVPRDPRGIVLACGFIGMAAVGVAALFPPTDPIGFGFLAAAGVGYFFLQTRFLPMLLWLLVAAYGAAGGVAGAPVDWVESALGLLLAVVALVPVPPQYREDSAKPRRPKVPAVTPPPWVVSAPGNTSTLPEVSAPTNGESSTEKVEDSASGIALETAPAGSRTAGKPLVIRCIGALEIRSSARDLAPELQDKAVLNFLFSYLLARLVLGDPKVARSAVGDELSPDIAAKSQRDRLRKQLYDLQMDVGPELGQLIRRNRTHVWLELDGTDSDIAELRELAIRARRSEHIITSELASEIRQMLDVTNSQEFLAGFEELENKITRGRGTAGDVVRNARLHIAAQRAELVCALAEYQDALGHPEAAIPYLQSALEAQPDRVDLARLLVVAYLKSGQTARASELRRQFALKQE